MGREGCTTLIHHGGGDAHVEEIRSVRRRGVIVVGGRRGEVEKREQKGWGPGKGVAEGELVRKRSRGGSGVLEGRVEGVEGWSVCRIVFKKNLINYVINLHRHFRQSSK